MWKYSVNNIFNNMLNNVSLVDNTAYHWKNGQNLYNTHKSATADGVFLKYQVKNSINNKHFNNNKQNGYNAIVVFIIV